MDGEVSRFIRPVVMQTVVVVLSEDPIFREKIAVLLSDEGFLCRSSMTLAHVQDEAHRLNPMLVIVEGRIGSHDTATACHHLRSDVDCPMLAIDHGQEVLDRVLALELGADDYLAHPVAPRELLARTRALTRRRRMSVLGEPMPASGHVSWRLNLVTRQLRGPRSKRPVRLTPGEQSLLTLFLKNAGRALVPDALDERDFPSVSTGTFRVSVMRLRRKLETVGLERSSIRSVKKNGGYAFDPAVAAMGHISL